MSKKKKDILSDLESPALEQEQEHMRQVPEEPKVEQVLEEPRVDFDSWFAIRAGQIPAHHRKEIIKADFKARKTPDVATIAEFDKALEQYGVKLS